jgi:hypothetical protein
MTARRLWVISALVAGLALAGGLVLRTGASPSSAASLSRLSSPGVPVQLPASDPRTKRLEGAGYTSISALATVRDRTFYRFDLRSGEACFGTGNSAADWPIGTIMCRIRPPYFPSPELPVLDLSMVGMDRGEATPTYLRIEGFAADGVARIGAVDAEGRVIARIPVDGNVYSAPAPLGTVRLVALGDDDQVLDELP